MVVRRGNTPLSTSNALATGGRMFSPLASASNASQLQQLQNGPASARNSSISILSSGGAGSSGGSSTGMDHALSGAQTSSYAQINMTDEEEDTAGSGSGIVARSGSGNGGKVAFMPIASGPPAPPLLRSMSPGGVVDAVAFPASTTGAPLPSHSHRLHPLLSLFYFAPVSAVALLPIQLWLEAPRLEASKFVDAGVWEPTLGLVLAGCILAFALNSSELYVIRETSALTLCVLGVSKFILVVLLSVGTGLQASLTPLNQMGIGLTIAGLVIYNVVKYRELNEAAALAASPSCARAEAAAAGASSSSSCVTLTALTTEDEEEGMPMQPLKSNGSNKLHGKLSSSPSSSLMARSGSDPSTTGGGSLSSRARAFSLSNSEGGRDAPANASVLSSPSSTAAALNDSNGGSYLQSPSRPRGVPTAIPSRLLTRTGSGGVSYGPYPVELLGSRMRDALASVDDSSTTGHFSLDDSGLASSSGGDGLVDDTATELRLLDAKLLLQPERMRSNSACEA
jgi:hypothetical protein